MLRFSAFGALLVIAVAAVLVGVNVRGWRDRLFPRHTNPPIQALAVLPLANLSGDPDQEYFADGMTEELMTDLAKSGLCERFRAPQQCSTKGRTSLCRRLRDR